MRNARDEEVVLDGTVTSDSGSTDSSSEVVAMVSVEIIAGMTAPDEQDDSDKRYGWYAACSGRIVLAPIGRRFPDGNSRITTDICQHATTDERKPAQELVFKGLLGDQSLETLKDLKPGHKGGPGL